MRNLEKHIRVLRLHAGTVGGLFEFEKRARLLPMEGMRGIAVGLVFLQHYCRQFIEDGHLSGATAAFASAFRTYGNNGVELFFVLSGFLIYGILLRKRPPFVDFMTRRAQRLYPAFLVSLAIGCLLDFLRAHPYIPRAVVAAAGYLLANLAFLPGLFPITPISAVNWSLSYEWWFYAGCTALFVSLGFSNAPARLRVAVVLSLSALLVLLSALHIPNVPVRGLSLLAGILLAETERARLPAIPAWLACSAVLLAFLLNISGVLPGWATAITLAASFYLLCSSAFFGQNRIANLLCFDGLRRLGNMSYSFYLVHGFAVIAILHVLLSRTSIAFRDWLFWLAIAPVFAAACLCGAGLFLAVEKPFSLQVRVPKKVSASAGTISS